MLRGVLSPFPSSRARCGQGHSAAAGAARRVAAPGGSGPLVQALVPLPALRSSPSSSAGCASRGSAGGRGGSATCREPGPPSAASFSAFCFCYGRAFVFAGLSRPPASPHSRCARAESAARPSGGRASASPSRPRSAPEVKRFARSSAAESSRGDARAEGCRAPARPVRIPCDPEQTRSRGPDAAFSPALRWSAAGRHDREPRTHRLRVVPPRRPPTPRQRTSPPRKPRAAPFTASQTR